METHVNFERRHQVPRFIGPIRIAPIEELMECGLAAPVTSGFPSEVALCGRWIDGEWKPQPDGPVDGFGGFDPR
jgi:hypothetical protein